MKWYRLLFFLCFGMLQSQNDKINELDEIVLRGKFSSLFNDGYQTKVINDSIFESELNSLGHVLQKEANFYFKQNGFGMVSSISLRGTGASQTGVYWNGIAINSALNGQTDFNTLGPSGFDALEIRKGGATVLLGNGSIGGAVNLKDRLVFDHKKSLKLMAGAGSFDTYNAQIKGVISSDKWSAKVAFGGISSANDYPYPRSDLKNENGAYKNFNINSSFGFKLNERHQFSLFGSLFDNHRNLSGTLSSMSSAQLDNIDKRLMLNWKFLGDAYTSSLKLALLSEEYQYIYDRNVSGQSSFGKSDRYVAKYDLSYFVAKNMVLSGGIDGVYAIGNGKQILRMPAKQISVPLLIFTMRHPAKSGII